MGRSYEEVLYMYVSINLIYPILSLIPVSREKSEQSTHGITDLAQSCTNQSTHHQPILTHFLWIIFFHLLLITMIPLVKFIRRSNTHDFPLLSPPI